ncbi:MAG: SDR family NAD(P)-dependent oxidoreductase [Candidatus Thorarchaeota archaeon]|nr:SDR family NAD(P)-dependent oxidoreductase [Candidatus Thorarchaeota archaeon]
MNYYDGKKVLVTGGAGFIGSHIAEYALREGAQVRILDDMSNGHSSNVEGLRSSKDFEMITGDIREKDIVRNALREISIVYHQAAKVSVPFSVDDPLTTLSVNSMGTTQLLDECRRADVEKFVVASSSSIYGDTLTLPKHEDLNLRPISPYGVSKLAQEALAMAFYETYGLNTTALRYFNVYGSRVRGGAYAGVISIFVTNALQNEIFRIEGDGQQTRDFTYVEDVVKANFLVSVTKSTAGRVYNVGSGNQTSILELAHRIIALTDSSSKIEYSPARDGDIRDSLASVEKLEKAINYRPDTLLDEGLEKTIDWFRKLK